MSRWLQIQIIWIYLFTAGCSNIPKEFLIASGAATGSGCGYAIDNKSPWATIGGATGGALLVSAVMARDKKSAQQGFDIGYIQGASDAIKRHYWMNQALHKLPANNEKQVYLSVPAPTIASDGKNLVPHNIIIPVVE